MSVDRSTDITTHLVLLVLEATSSKKPNGSSTRVAVAGDKLSTQRQIVAVAWRQIFTRRHLIDGDKKLPGYSDNLSSVTATFCLDPVWTRLKAPLLEV